ncbi:hypothetical protein G647_03773 [Cladophialophora carrionii CBS 160.54]|uniref:Uncharacterized protein n=1 Tax=Cladophialophora carrionii CBS 160.54 TaxID=1279043 RepID=V9DBZ4_9EURO|nr:uncharacterized protein G647_03773 [Cladophialophora carrionii CBS 160.54]ETI24404.1 hypothetical protein G647_03773 [Cladophialophora carrionii CBS 160.54]
MAAQQSISGHREPYEPPMAAISYIKNRYPSPPNRLGKNFGGLQSEGKANDSAVYPPVPILILSPPSSLPLSRSSTETNIEAAASSYAEPSNTNEDRPGLISGLTRNDEQRAVILNQFQVDRMLKEFVEHNDCELLRSPTELYWLPIRGIDKHLRLVDATELLRRLEVLRDYRLPWAKSLVDCDESVVVSIDTPTSGCPKPWSDIRRMAIAGLLEQYPPEDMAGLLGGIRRHLYRGQHSKLQYQPVWKDAQPVLEQTETTRPVRSKKEPASDNPGKITIKISARALAISDKKQRASTACSSSQNGTSSEATSEEDASVARPPEPRIGTTLESRATKRKASRALEDDVPVASPPQKQARVTGESSATKRHRTRDGSTTRVISPSERFGLAIKKFFAARSPAKDDFGHFKGAIMPAGGPDANLAPLDETTHPDFQASLDKQSPRGKLGDTADLHESEVRLCQLLDMPAAQYKCQKARSFVGLAMWIEYNEQRRQTEAAPPARMQAFNKTQLQQCCNVDVNKASRLWIAFKAWGWLGDEEMVKSVPSGLDQMFPREYRLGWVREMQKFEREKVPEADRSKCVDWDLGA